MVQILIVLGLLALGVAIVAFATRRPATRQDVVVDQDTAWNDPITPANDAPAQDDPFAHAPVLTPTPEVVASEAVPAERAS